MFGVKPGVEPSTITDFHGFVGGAVITGHVKQIDLKTGATTSRFFDNDMRFMQGHYVEWMARNTTEPLASSE